jgi:hypothetical protein
MKNNAWVFIVIAGFLIFLYLGVKMGEDHSRLEPTPPPLPDSTSSSPQAPKQYILLVILVEDGKAKKTVLEGVWLINLSPSQASVKIFPLLPSQSENGENRDRKLASAFDVDHQQRVNAKFLNLLGRRGVEWDGYIIADQWFLVEIIDYLGGLDLGYGLQSGSEILGEMAHWSEDRLLAQHDQAQLLKSGCWKMVGSSQHISLDDLQKLFPAHFSMNGTPPSLLEQIWRDMKEKDGMMCETPTLPNLSP